MIRTPGICETLSENLSAQMLDLSRGHAPEEILEYVVCVGLENAQEPRKPE
jgi:hypothetical protein